MAEPEPKMTPGPGEANPPPPDPDVTAADGSLLDDLREVVDDGRTLVEAELAYQSARFAFLWNRAAVIVTLLLVALAAGFAALIALVVGLLIALTPVLGVWGALGVMTLALLLSAYVAQRMARRRFRVMRAKLISGAQLPPSRERVDKVPLGRRMAP